MKTFFYLRALEIMAIRLSWELRLVEENIFMWGLNH